MDLFSSPLEDEEMSLRELAMPSMEDLEMQKSDLVLATTHYEVKPRIIKLVATKPFRGLEDDNPYRHIKEFTMICNTVQQGVPAAWFKWNLFPFSLEDEARRWLGRPRFSAGFINPNDPVNRVDFGPTTANLGHHLENITDNP
jgi:hypothetical protein